MMIQTIEGGVGKQQNKKKPLIQSEQTTVQHHIVPPLHLKATFRSRNEQDAPKQNNTDRTLHYDSVFKEESEENTLPNHDTSRFGDNDNVNTQNHSLASPIPSEFQAQDSILQHGHRVEPLFQNSIAQDSVFNAKPSILVEHSREDDGHSFGIQASIIAPHNNTNQKQYHNNQQQDIGQQAQQHYNSTIHNSSGLNPSWLKTSSGGSSTQNNNNQQINRFLDASKVQQQTQNNVGVYNAHDGEGGQQNNILVQLLQQSYQQAVSSYKQHNPGQEQSKMTRQVMAALTDPSVKNKMQMITKICDGGREKKRQTLTKNENESVDLLAQYLAHNKQKSKPRSQAITARSNRRRPHNNHHQVPQSTRNKQTHRFFNTAQNSRESSIHTGGNSCQQQQQLQPLYQTMIDQRNSEHVNKKNTTSLVTPRNAGSVDVQKIRLSMKTAQISLNKNRKPQTGHLHLRLKNGRLENAQDSARQSQQYQMQNQQNMLKNDNRRQVTDKRIGSDDQVNNLEYDLPTLKSTERFREDSKDKLITYHSNNDSYQSGQKFGATAKHKKRSVFMTAPQQESQPQQKQINDKIVVSTADKNVENQSENFDKTLCIEKMVTNNYQEENHQQQDNQNIVRYKLSTIEATTLLDGSEGYHGADMSPWPQPRDGESTLQNSGKIMRYLSIMNNTPSDNSKLQDTDKSPTDISQPLMRKQNTHDNQVFRAQNQGTKLSAFSEANKEDSTSQHNTQKNVKKQSTRINIDLPIQQKTIDVDLKDMDDNQVDDEDVSVSVNDEGEENVERRSDKEAAVNLTPIQTQEQDSIMMMMLYDGQNIPITQQGVKHSDQQMKTLNQLKLQQNNPQHQLKPKKQSSIDQFSKKERKYPKSRPPAIQPLSTRNSMQIMMSTKGAPITTVISLATEGSPRIENIVNNNNAKNDKVMIKKSTVFSFDCVPDKFNQDSKGALIKHPPSRSILAGHGITQPRDPMKQQNNVNNSLGKVISTQGSQSIKMSHPLVRGDLNNILPQIGEQIPKSKEELLPSPPWTARQIIKGSKDMTKIIEKPKLDINNSVIMNHEDHMADAGTSPMEGRATSSFVLSPKVYGHDQYKFQVIENGGVQANHRVVNFASLNNQQQVLGQTIGDQLQRNLRQQQQINQHASMEEQEQANQYYQHLQGSMRQSHMLRLMEQPNKHNSQMNALQAPPNMSMDANGQPIQVIRHPSMNTNSHTSQIQNIKLNTGVHKVSDGVFSSDAGLSPMLRGQHLQPQYNSIRPLTQDMNKRPKMSINTKVNIILENCVAEASGAREVDTAIKQENSQQHIETGRLSQRDQSIPTKNDQELLGTDYSQSNRNNNQNQEIKVQHAQSQQEHTGSSDKLRMQGFRLGSLKNDKSVLQEDILSRKSNADPASYQYNVENEQLHEIFQPDLIKIMAKNGENVVIASPPSSSYKPQHQKTQVRQSRLERRIECQAQRVIKSPPREPQQQPRLAAKQDYKPITMKCQESLGSKQDSAQAQIADRYRERSHHKALKFPASFIKQKISYQVNLESQQQTSQKGARENAIPSEDITMYDNSIYDNDSKERLRTVGNAVRTVKFDGHVESTKDFDIMELQKLEAFDGDAANSHRHAAHNQQNDHQFLYAQALPISAFNLSLQEKRKEVKGGGNEQFIPQLKHAGFCGGSLAQTRKDDSKITGSQERSIMYKSKMPFEQDPETLCHQIYFDPLQKTENESKSIRNSPLNNSSKVNGISKLQTNLGSLRTKDGVQDTFLSLEAIQMKQQQSQLNQQQPPLSSFRSTASRFNGGDGRYRRIEQHISQQQQFEPREILKLGKILNLKKQNHRKQILSLENQRICTQEDRVFNERIKMANAMGQKMTQLPKFSTKRLLQQAQSQSPRLLYQQRKYKGIVSQSVRDSIDMARKGQPSRDLVHIE